MGKTVVRFDKILFRGEKVEMSSKNIRFALAGCGNIAKKHVHVIQNYLENAEIVGVCDKAYDRAKFYGEKLGIPSFSSIQGMMDEIRDNIDIDDL